MFAASPEGDYTMGKRPGLTKKTIAPPKALKANRVSMVDTCGPSTRETSIEVRKIENGYIVRETSYSGRGGYKSSERFSEKAPTVQVEPTKTRK